MSLTEVLADKPRLYSLIADLLEFDIETTAHSGDQDKQDMADSYGYDTFAELERDVDEVIKEVRGG